MIINRFIEYSNINKIQDECKSGYDETILAVYEKMQHPRTTDKKFIQLFW